MLNLEKSNDNAVAWTYGVRVATIVAIQLHSHDCVTNSYLAFAIGSRASAKFPKRKSKLKFTEVHDNGNAATPVF